MRKVALFSALMPAVFIVGAALAAARVQRYELG
jgi:hypothetical protein